MEIWPRGVPGSRKTTETAETEATEPNAHACTYPNSTSRSNTATHSGTASDSATYSAAASDSTTQSPAASDTHSNANSYTNATNHSYTYSHSNALANHIGSGIRYERRRWNWDRSRRGGNWRGSDGQASRRGYRHRRRHSVLYGPANFSVP